MNDQITPATAKGGPGSGEGAAEGGTAAPVGGQPYLHDIVTAVCAPAMALSGPDGQIRAAGAQGIYVRDVRALSEMVLSVGGQEPVALGHDRPGGSTSTFHSVVRIGPPEVDPRVLVTRERKLNANGVCESFTIKAFAPPPFDRRVELKLSSDLAGIAAVKGGLAGPRRPATATADGLSWELPGSGSVRAVADPAPDEVDADSGRLAWDISVAGGGAVTLSLSVQVHEDQASGAVVSAPERRAPSPLPSVTADDERLGRLVEASLADLDQLQMVMTSAPQDVFVAAGAPWYLTLFGRDSVWTARMLLPLGTDLALGTLRALARLQGRAVDPHTAEEPGKIPHEVRREQVKHNQGGAGGGSFTLPQVYYGTVDATPLWVCLLHDAWRWGAPAEAVEGLIEPMRRCLEWMAGFGAGPTGFVSYLDELGQGLTNQGWKDSYDGVQFRDGRLAGAPLALCEVQGYCHEAALDGAALLDAFGLDGADRWRDFAGQLAERFRARFWVEDDEGPYPAIALDVDGRPVDSVSSNMGHLLGTGILDAGEAEAVSRRLLGADLNCGFGLRTLAGSSAGYNPLSYHCGSVWAHDTAIAIAGLAASGGPVARQAAASLIDGLIDAAEALGYRVPELYGGHEKTPRRQPIPYPAACHPQAWTAAASVTLLNALAGLRPNVPQSRLTLAPLSSTVGLKKVEGLVVGGWPIDISIGADGKASVEGAPEGLQVVA